ncbi:MAG: APC family permease [Thermoprotei archaeon]
MVSELRRRVGLVVKLAAAVTGIIALCYGVLGLAQELTYLSTGVTPDFVDLVYAIGLFLLFVTGSLMVSLLPSSLRTRFRLPKFEMSGKPVYGFSQVLAIGLGATIGSPLFVLIPENILQYELVSIGALLAATVLSTLMAKVYADMYIFSQKAGKGAVGGPSFTRVACGVKSLRYFIARVSMWVANTALAAYSKIVFVIFDVEFLPRIMAHFGYTGLPVTLLVYAIAAVFVGWSVASAILERRLMRSVGSLQILFTSFMVLALVYHSVLLGNVGNWNIGGIFNAHLSGNWVEALVIDTGYLYLLFFGFQEIQSLEKDVKAESSVPFLSWVKKGFTVSKGKYLGYAMILSVVMASAINILYALAVYAVHPNVSTVFSSQIPALYLAKTYLGAYQELLMAVVFLVATLTTFVPAFLAASRHMSSLCEDGYMPRSLAPYSWVFTYGSILFLALGGEDFLVNITNVMVLLSLGIISLSAIWLKRKVSERGSKALPLGVGLSCFVAGGAIYFIDPRVTLFAALTLLLMYLVYDVLLLGSTGSTIFLMILDACFTLLYLSVPSIGFPAFNAELLNFTFFTFSMNSSAVEAILALSVFVLLLSVGIDFAFKPRSQEHFRTRSAPLRKPVET